MAQGSDEFPEIGILGAGDIGQSLARRFSAAGLRFAICNSRGPESLAALVGALGDGARAVTTAEVLAMDHLILAIRWRLLPEIVATGSWTGKLIIDSCNPTIPSGVKAPEYMSEKASSLRVAELMPGARIVKTFNTLSAELLGSDPRVPGGRRVMFVSGDDMEAKAFVLRLVEAIGFAAVDLGGLAMGGLMQQYPGGSLADRNLIQLDEGMEQEA